MLVQMKQPEIHCMLLMFRNFITHMTKAKMNLVHGNTLAHIHRHSRCVTRTEDSRNYDSIGKWREECIWNQCGSSTSSSLYTITTHPSNTHFKKLLCFLSGKAICVCVWEWMSVNEISACGHMCCIAIPLAHIIMWLSSIDCCAMISYQLIVHAYHSLGASPSA